MTADERRELQRLRRQRDQLHAALRDLVTSGLLGLIPGADYTEIHRRDIRKAARLVKRIQQTL
ncbi:MAG: hypothetical protein KAX77_00880 [Xanthomonadales bacterium]|nr:hypothetical protein [Xanthomonadales bacterium]